MGTSGKRIGKAELMAADVLIRFPEPVDDGHRVGEWHEDEVEPNDGSYE